MKTEKGIKLIVTACEAIIKDDQAGELMQRAVAATEQGYIDSAIELAKKAVGINTIHTDPAVMLGVLLLHEKSNRIHSLGYFNQVITQDPNNALALWYLACDKLRGGRIPEALALLQAATECEPIDSYAMATFVWLLNMLGKINSKKSIIDTKLLRNLPQVICPTLAIFLMSQENVLSSTALNHLLRNNMSCLKDLEKVVESPSHGRELLEVMIDKSSGPLNRGKGSHGILCPHIENPALDLYKYRFGRRIVEYYVKSFSEEILFPEIKRIFRKKNITKQQPAMENIRIPPDMVLVKAGQYIVGVNIPSLKYPERKVLLQAFLIDKYPVTNKQWREFQPNHTFPQGHENDPVTNVDFVQATLYARWKGKRLPTETEWEAAARGPEGLRFPWGQVPDIGRASCGDRKPKGIAPVTQYPRGASPFGAMDMLGNTMEWVDEWGPPIPNAGCINRLLKGGGFNVTAANLACWLRSPIQPITKSPSIGFRCVMDI